MSGVPVLVTSRSYSSGRLDLVGRLREAGAEVVYGDAGHGVEELRPLLRASVAWIAGASPITGQHLDCAPALRLVARYGVGVDAVDLDAARRRHVLVTNTPGANSDAVAEHALALLLAALRHVVAGDRGVRGGVWTVHRARELRDLTVGVLGFGRIGSSFARRLEHFGTQVLAHDPALPDEDLRRAGVRPVSLQALAAQSDVVSLHAPGGGVVVDEGWLRACRPGAILVNTARAGLVDEAAVAHALRDGRLATYAADDLSGTHGEGGNALLAEELADRVILTPHTAAQTIQAVDNMGAAATAAVLAVLSGRRPDNVVSGP